MNLPPIIGLNGYKQSGKDTTGGILRDLFGYQRVAFADELRAFIYRQDLWTPYGTKVNDLISEFGWDEAKEGDSYIRGIQLFTGTEAGRALDPDLWVSAAFRHAPQGMLVITDMRFPNEFDAVKARDGVTWRVERPGNTAAPHISDTALDNHDFDAVIQNDGTVADLAHKVIDRLSLPKNGLQRAHNEGVRA